MKVPNAERAVIAIEKLRGYLLNRAHRRGAPKARLLNGMGYSADNWQRLEADLRGQHLPCDIELTSESVYGLRFEIVGPLTGPNGSVSVFRSIWQIDVDTDTPRLITMYPE